MVSATKMLGLAKLEKKIRRLPEAATAMIKVEMEAAADEIVALAKSLAQSKRVQDSVGWTWGAPPQGAITLGKVAASSLGKGLTLTIYAGNSEAFWARWEEFGTAPRGNHPGTKARAFFFPAYRAGRKSAKRRVRAGVRRAARQVAAS